MNDGLSMTQNSSISPLKESPIISVEQNQPEIGPEDSSLPKKRPVKTAQRKVKKGRRSAPYRIKETTITILELEMSPREEQKDNERMDVEQ